MTDYVEAINELEEENIRLRTERDEARQWSAAWKHAAKKYRHYYNGCLLFLSKALDEIVELEQRDAARAKMPPLSAFGHRIVDGRTRVKELEHHELLCSCDDCQP